MNKTRFSFLLWAFLLFFAFPVHALLEPNFKKLNMQDGLAGNSVYSIFKDRDGFIWFGTGDGLSRYDGKNIRSFTSDKYSMSIRQMYDTSGGELLFIAGNSLHCFDRYRERFIELPGLEGQTYYETRGLVLQNDSTYWSISGNKLHLLKRVLGEKQETKEPIVLLKVLKEFQFADNDVVLNAICESHDKNKLFMATVSGKLIIFDVEKGEPDTVVSLFAERPEAYQVSSLACDKDNLWITTLAGGVMRYHFSDCSLEFFSRHSQAGKALTHDDVYAMIADRKSVV